MKLYSAVITHIGYLRDINQDNWYLNGMVGKSNMPFTEAYNIGMTGPNTPHVCSYAVLDGMGGGSHGDLAARIAAETFAEYSTMLPQADYDRCIQIANLRIFREARARKVRHMGAAAAALRIQGNTASVCNLGDSRIYRYSEGLLTMLSEDHRRTDPSDGSIVLTQHLGISPEEFIPEPHILKDIPISPGMILMLCTDGLTDVVTDKQIAQVLASASDERPAEIARRLLRQTLDAGGSDNITILVILLRE